MSPAGTSVNGPMWRWSSVMNDWQNRITSPSVRPFGSKSAPPLPAPSGSVVDPRHPEHHDALGLDDPLEDPGVHIAGVPLQGQLDRPGDLVNRLMELRFPRVLRGQLVHDAVRVVAHRVLSRVRPAFPG